jgi:hypothetical protein
MIYLHLIKKKNMEVKTYIILMNRAKKWNKIYHYKNRYNIQKNGVLSTTYGRFSNF